MAVKKLIITHYENLNQKYKTIMVENTKPALQEIEQRLNHLIAFDSKRGIDTVIVYLDRDEKLGSHKVMPPADDAKFKRAVDEACRVYNPDYLVILGAQDIVPYIRLQHPVYRSKADYRKHLYSDMPYACEQEYSDLGSDFLFPARVVSRIPDVLNNAELGASALLSSLDAVIKTPTQDAPEYLNPWAACTSLRQKPMREILETMYADEDKIPAAAVCPPATSDWPEETYKRLIHIHLLNGIAKSHLLYGEDETHARPPAVNCELLKNKMKPGCIVLERASCGGQLYQPIEAKLPLVNTYLSSGAACVLGCIADNYGNTEKMVSADHLVSQFFLNLYNRAVGDAFLISRQWVLLNKHLLSPHDTAMFLGFTLYGDASALPMGDAQPNFSAQTKPRAAGGYETNPSRLRQNACFSCESIDKPPISAQDKTYMEAYLLVNYNIQKVTRFYCNEVFENGILNDKKIQYTAYILKTPSTGGEYLIHDFPAALSNDISGFYEEWYVFEVDAKGITFKVQMIPD